MRVIVPDRAHAADGFAAVMASGGKPCAYAQQEVTGLRAPNAIATLFVTKSLEVPRGICMCTNRRRFRPPRMRGTVVFRGQSPAGESTGRPSARQNLLPGTSAGKKKAAPGRPGPLTCE